MFGKLFRPRTLLGIDTGSQAIKVVEVEAEPGRPFQVVAMGSAPSPSDLFERGQIQDPKALGEAIRQAVAAAGSKQRKAALAVPAQVGFVRRLTFPRMPLQELRASIDLQPDRYIPFAREGAVYDLYPLPAEPAAQEMVVILAAAPRPVVEALMKAAKLAGLVPVRIDLQPLTLLRAAVATGQYRRNAVIGIVDLGGSSAKISLFEGEVPVISRVIEMAPVEPADRAAIMHDLFWDIRRSLEFALTQLRVPPSRLLVTGGLADEYLALSLAGYLRGILANRLPGDFAVEPIRDGDGRIPSTHMLAFGLSLPPELFT